MSQAKTTTPTSKNEAAAQDALELLKADHERVLELFEQFEAEEDDEEKAALAEQICTELTIHAQLEEEIFYPAVREAIGDDDLMDEAAVEHDGAMNLIEQIEDAQPGDEKFDAKVTVLGEYVKHHVEEEQSEMFPKVKKSKLDLKEIGAAMLARKTELQAELA